MFLKVPSQNELTINVSKVNQSILKIKCLFNNKLQTVKLKTDLFFEMVCLELKDKY